MYLHQQYSLVCIIDFHQKSKVIAFAFASTIFSVLYHWLSSKKQSYNLCSCIKNILYFVSLTFIKKARLQPLHLHQKHSLFCIIDFHQKCKVITFAFASKLFSTLYLWLSSKKQGYNLLHLHQKHCLFCIVDFHQNSKVITFVFASKIFSILYHWLSSKSNAITFGFASKIFSSLYQWLSSKK